MMSMKVFLFICASALLLMSTACNAQFFHQPVHFVGSSLIAPSSFPIARAAQPVREIGHRAVIENAEEESHLPEQLKNPFYKNPRIAQALAKESWFYNGEEEVKQREAEKIPRQKVFSILKHAGFI